MAEVFGVNLEWLIRGGEGPLWRKELFEQEFALLRARLLDPKLGADGGVEGAPGVAPLLRTLEPHVRLIFWSTWRRVAEASGRKGLPPDVGQALSEYVAAMSQSVSLALKIPHAAAETL